MMPSRSPAPACGLFDGLLGGDPEAKARREAEKEEQFRAQQEMMARRRDPKKMEAYFQEVEASRRAEMAKDAELRQLQKGASGGDQLEDWNRLKEAGKVQSMDDMERDKDSERAGSAGLIGERIDEKLPYIDAGYVDESQPDLMEGLKKLFGGDK